MSDYRKKSNEPIFPNKGNIDIDALAELIANKVSKDIKIPSNNGIIPRGFSSTNQPEEEFDATSSMNQLAQSMIVQRGSKSSNFDDLGGVQETKKDNTQTNNTIDLLAGLED